MMIIEQLYDDDKINDLCEPGTNLVNSGFHYVNRLIVEDIRNDYEAALSAQAAEIERMKAALEEAEDIRDDLVSNADSIGELLFGDYAEEDPTGNGNERYWPKDHGTPDHVATVHLGYGTAKEVARLINEMMDSDWVDTTGKRQIHSPIVAAEFDPDEAIMIACPQCGAEQQDFDGFGVIHCESCGYCVHPSCTGGVCGICGQVQP